MKTCPVCEGKQVKSIYNQTLLSCQQCSHVWADLSINEETLREIYAENYFKGEEYADYLADKLILQTNFSKRLDALQKLNPNPKFENVLEIGCAYGFFGEIMVKRFSDKKYVGFDISVEAVTFANQHFGPYFFSENYLSAKLEEAPFSDVFMWDVIEHLPSPQSFVKKIASETASGSRIYITTGDISAWLPRRQKEKWRMIHPPTHIHYFSKKSIKQLLENVDFEIEKVTYPPVNRSLRIIFYSLFMLNKKQHFLSKIIYKCIPEKASIRINTRDIMFVIARKK